MIVVSGGAGFIGSNLVRGLNSQGVQDILVVDELDDRSKLANLARCRMADAVDKDVFLRELRAGRMGRPEVVFHLGACTDTTLQDETHLMNCNTRYSLALVHWAVAARVPLVYSSSAAVYGDSPAFAEVPENERPLNLYAASKLRVDQEVRKLLPAAESTLVGLRYFNVYGPGEAHKGRMASMVFQTYRQLCERRKVALFAGSHGFGAGEQRRDFVHVDDVVKANLFFGFGPARKGIVNVGTGGSHSFNDVARAWISVLGFGEIEYIPLPRELAAHYQSYTQADLSALRALGYKAPFLTLEQGIARCHRAFLGKTETPGVMKPCLPA